MANQFAHVRAGLTRLRIRLCPSALVYHRYPISPGHAHNQLLHAGVSSLCFIHAVCTGHGVCTTPLTTMCACYCKSLALSVVALSSIWART
jgi:hypothetical protein